MDLGIPYELWDKPSAEITQLKTQCEEMLEQYESDIEDWYEERQGEVTLQEYLCKNVVLRHDDSSCLFETLPATNEDQKTENFGSHRKTEL